MEDKTLGLESEGPHCKGWKMKDHTKMMS